MKTTRIIAGAMSLLIMTGAVTVSTSAVSVSAAETLTSTAFTEGVYNDCLEYYKFKDCVEIKRCTANFVDVVVPAEIDGLPVTRLLEKAFNKCYIKSVTLPDTIKYVGDYQFACCGTIKEVVFPDSVEYIGSHVFYDCRSIEKVVFPKNVKYLGDCGFVYCKNLSEVTLPENLTEIGDQMFSDCRALAEITIPKTVKSIGNAAFMGCALSEVDLPDGLEYLGRCCFGNNSGIKDVKIPDSVVSSGNRPFLGTNWERNYLKEHDYMVIGNALVAYNSNLTELVVPNGVKVIPDGLCSTNDKITSVKLPDSVVNIEDSAFYGCKKLTEINLPDSVKHIGRLAFMYVPWFEDRKADNDTIIENKCLLWANDVAGDFTIPEGVTCVADEAVNYADDVTDIIVPDGVADMTYTTIELPKSVKNVKIADSVITLNEYRFNRGMNVEFGGNVRRIEDHALGIYPGTSFTFPEGVEYLGEGVFSGSNLEDVTLPASLKKLDKQALARISELKSVTFLSKDCEIYDAVDTICHMDKSWNYTGVIRGYKGSTAEAYANKYGFTFIALNGQPADPDVIICGDISGDGAIDASDATLVLVEYASISTGMTTTLTPAQFEAADVNGDGTINADDASKILAYYAYVSTGGSDIGIRPWLDSQK